MSGNIFMFSDPHFGHTNMALKRGFETVEEHDEHIISQWNKVVRKKDVVYILGDVTMEKSTNYHVLDRLTGMKKIVLGNHDKPQHVKELLNYVNSVCGMIRIRKCILTHAPIHSSEVGRFALNIHGHVHEKSIEDPKYYNVSAEVIDYTPVSMDNILKSRNL